jgi:hypothetical protein
MQTKEDTMSTDAPTPAGQAPAVGRTSPQTLVQESIKYRRRAQEAERRAEALETEVQALREAQDDRGGALEQELAQVRGEAETLRRQVETVQRERSLERELARAGCADTETALALARERLADLGAPGPEDLAAFARSLLEEKPHLRTAADVPARAGATRGLPPRTVAPQPPAHATPRRMADRLAEQARQSGSSTDLMAYMRARRATGA